MTAPIIVTATFGAADFAWLDDQRRAHFPPDRNRVPAHLTLFHHLPPSLEPELARRVAEEARSPAPRAEIVEPFSLGRGVAYRVRSDDLAVIRARLADVFEGLLTPQDQAGWRPHITIQNKVDPAEARALLAALSRDFRPRPLRIAGLASWWYRGGDWEPIGAWTFRGSNPRATLRKVPGRCGLHPPPPSACGCHLPLAGEDGNISRSGRRRCS